MGTQLTTLPPLKPLLSWEAAMEQIQQIGIEEAPHEACGVLVPQDEFCRYWTVHQLKNRAADTMAGYEIDPATIGQIEADPAVWGLVRVWHTHPSGHVGPSQGDMEHAREGVKYLVVAIPSGEWREFSA